MYGYLCEKCGAHLDPGEHCDCEEAAEQERVQTARRTAEMFVLDKGSNQFRIKFTEGAPA